MASVTEQVHKVDVLINEMEHAYHNVRKFKTSRVKLPAKELNLLCCFEEIRNTLWRVVKDGDRETLQEIFGGNFARMARIRAVVETAQFSPMTSEDRICEGVLSACEATENVLLDIVSCEKLKEAKEAAKTKLMEGERPVDAASTVGTCARSACQKPRQGNGTGQEHCSRECMEMDEDDALAELQGGGEQLPIKRAFLDFDQTISRTHVFNLLAGWEKAAVPPPFAFTDRGQISKITALNTQGPSWTYDERRGIVAAGPTGGCQWTRAALGGAARVEMLRSLFAELRAKGVVLTVITKGYVGAVKKLLSEEGLLENFESVTGFTDKYYGDSDFDKACKPSDLEGGPESALVTSKSEFIWKVLQRESLKEQQAVLVEDDPAEIGSVRQPRVCRAVFVRKRLGMMAMEMDRLRQLASLSSAPLPPGVAPLPQAAKKPSGVTPPPGPVPPKAPGGVAPSPVPLPPKAQGGVAPPPTPAPPPGVGPPQLPPGVAPPPLPPGVNPTPAMPKAPASTVGTCARSACQKPRQKANSTTLVANLELEMQRHGNQNNAPGALRGQDRPGLVGQARAGQARPDPARQDRDLPGRVRLVQDPTPSAKHPVQKSQRDPAQKSPNTRLSTEAGQNHGRYHDGEYAKIWDEDKQLTLPGALNDVLGLFFGFPETAKSIFGDRRNDTEVRQPTRRPNSVAAWTMAIIE